MTGFVWQHSYRYAVEARAADDETATAYAEYRNEFYPSPEYDDLDHRFVWEAFEETERRETLSCSLA